MKTLLILLLLTPFVAFANQVNLAWEPSPTPGVIGYELRYSQEEATLSSGDGANIIDVGKVLTYSLNGLDKGTWYFTVLAYNNVVKSDLSNIVSFTEEGVVIAEKLHIPVQKPASVSITIEIK